MNFQYSSWNIFNSCHNSILFLFASILNRPPAISNFPRISVDSWHDHQQSVIVLNLECPTANNNNKKKNGKDENVILFVFLLDGKLKEMEWY